MAGKERGPPVCVATVQILRDCGLLDYRPQERARPFKRASVSAAGLRPATMNASAPLTGVNSTAITENLGANASINSLNAALATNGVLGLACLVRGRIATGRNHTRGASS